MNAPISEQFGSVFGSAPAGVWMAPGRVNLIGEHTDYNDGFVLPLALAQRAVVALAPARGGQSTVGSAQRAGELVRFAATDECGAVGGWAAYVAGVFWALREAGHPVPDCDVLVDSDVPAGAGLSSSAALECAVATALSDLLDLGLSRTELAILSQRAENDYVGAPTGIMDQMASMLGQAGDLVLIDTRSLAAAHIPLPLSEFGLELLVIDSHTPHALVDGQYAQRRRTCQDAAELLGVAALRDIGLDGLPHALEQLPSELMRRRVRHVVTENARVTSVAEQLTSGADPRQIGPELTASHVSLRDDYEVSAVQVDVAVETALAEGAFGARITGGGFGGSAIALVEAGQAEPVFAAVGESYTKHGFGPPSYLVAEPSPGAGRLL